MSYADLFQEFKGNKDDLSNEFSGIAKNLMSKFCIQVGDEKFAIFDVEFYYWSNAHPDPYIYAASKKDKEKEKDHISCQRQGDMGLWYFHYSGIDLTFGNKEKSEYGGILIRGIAPLDNPEPKHRVRGPLRSLLSILNSAKNLMNKTDFELIEEEHSLVGELNAYPRFGLSTDVLKNHDLDNKYRNRQYRFSDEIPNPIKRK